MDKNKIIYDIFVQIKAKKKQIMIAGILLVAAVIPISVSHFYTTATAADDETEVTQEAPESTQASERAAETVPADHTVAEKAYVPTPGELNLAYYFPEGADRTKITESLAGQAFKILMTQDDTWIGNIYEMADASPVQMAAALGRSKKQVTGSYNHKDERHNPNDPETWTVNSFKKVRMTFTNGDGQAVSAYSNVIDIMSMANLYTYFKGVEDYDLFLTYAKQLWEESHSYKVGLSDIYYCSGCLDEDAERREAEELEAEAIAEEAGYAREADASVSSGETGADNVTDASATSLVIEAGLFKPVKEEPSVSAAEAEAPETIPESTSGVVVSGRGTPAAVLAGQQEMSAAEQAANRIESEPSQNTSVPQTNAALETVEPAGETVDDQPATPSDAAKPMDAVKQENTQTAGKCPGHVDLIVNVKVIGIQEENGLFQKDTIGNHPDNIEENGWQGWNNYTKASARLLSSQDWFDKYGLSLSVISMRNPLSDAEIESYMNQLPADLSQTRKDIIRFALESVGKVPYYWGGKPSSPNYNGNSFGILAAPDQKGRVLKGLDCSGWINWVYWSVTGKRLPYESTSGLAISGTKISRSALQPGDIIVRTGTDAHVIMFLGWTPDGKIRCIHESSAGVNNVTVAIRDANWPYYRKLVD